jgi:hypothetical protein
MSTTIEIHVTRVDGEAVYGHETHHCDESGCNGHEQYYPEISGLDVCAHDVVDARLWRANRLSEARMNFTDGRLTMAEATMQQRANEWLESEGLDGSDEARVRLASSLGALLEQTREEGRQQVLDIVRRLSRPDLADLREALQR